MLASFPGLLHFDYLQSRGKTVRCETEWYA